ncbi:replicative DNA helicase, partial [Ureaplasma urealyticum serovar 9 str. ATCC 33175]
MSTKDLNDAILDLFCLVINNNDFWKDVILRLEAKDFPEKVQQNIFNTIANLNEQKYKISESNILNGLGNYVIVYEQDQNYLLHKNYLVQILERTDYLVDLKDCIEIIKNASIKNKLDLFANEILSTQISLTNAKDQFKEMHEKFLEILASRTEDTIENMEL